MADHSEDEYEEGEEFIDEFEVGSSGSSGHMSAPLGGQHCWGWGLHAAWTRYLSALHNCIAENAVCQLW